MICIFFLGLAVTEINAQISLRDFDEKTELENFIKTQSNYASLVAGRLENYLKKLWQLLLVYY